MPQENNILNIDGLRVRDIEGVNPLYISAEGERRPNCVRCGGVRLHLKKRKERVLHHENMGLRKCYLKLDVRQFKCRDCGRYFYERFKGIRKWQRATTAFRHEVYELHREGISQSQLSRLMQISSATIERWYHQLVEWKDTVTDHFVLPKVIGIDEHRFSRKDGFATTICDLKNRRIFDVVLGRSESAVYSQLSGLRGRKQVEKVCMDLSETYRNVARQHFPNATIIADRFHVIRLVNQHFLKAWHELDPSAKHSRGLLSLMRRHQWRLSEEQVEKLKRYLKSVPGLYPIYLFKQELIQIMLYRTKTIKKTKRQIRRLLFCIEELRNSGFTPLETLGNTLDSWKEEIAAMWASRYTNSITEGFHRKMKLIQRRAYGFKNFENYRLRVCALCG